jgi:hypothetical protein
MSKIFVSYSRVDHEFVDRLVRTLESAGHEVFYDQYMAVGESFVQQLSDAVETAEVVLLVLSPDYLESAWARTEWQLALVGDVEKKRRVIPLLVRDCQLPGLLRTIPSIDFRDDYDAAIARLLSELGTSSDDADRTAGLLVDQASIGRIINIGSASNIHLHSAPPAEDELRTLLTQMREAVESFKQQPIPDSKREENRK